METKIYQCICGAAFEKQAQLTAHKSRCKTYRESVGLPTIFICQYCGKECKDSSSLSKHINKEHLGKVHSDKPKMECPICKRLISNSNLEKHIKRHETRPNDEAKISGNALRYKLNHDGLECQFCGKICKNRNSLCNHERLCRHNPNKQQSSLIAYNKSYKRVAWNKGLTKETDARIAQKAAKAKEYYMLHPEKHKGYTHSEDIKKQIGTKMSQILKAKYDSGELTPNHGIGRGKGSYIVIGDDKYFCRSTYEFIYALYLFYILKKQFSIEKIQVEAIRENLYGNTFRCDFYILEDNLIVEIKGIKSDKDQLLKESFEAAGYNFVEIFQKDIEKCKKDLINYGIDIKNLLKNVVEGANKKDYFVYELT